jgi:hypothetical protein
LCEKVIAAHAVTGRFRFFAQHNRGSNIFRADPNYTTNNPWYDWAEIKWDEGLIPAKLLLFWDISEEQFRKPFTVNTTTIKSHGKYAIAYSLPCKDNIQKAHGASRMVQWGTIDTDGNNIPNLCLFSVDCIAGALTAVPYKVEESIVSAKEWIFLRPKCEWYSIFINLINETLQDQESNKKQHKRKRIHD